MHVLTDIPYGSVPVSAVFPPAILSPYSERPRKGGVLVPTGNVRKTLTNARFSIDPFLTERQQTSFLDSHAYSAEQAKSRGEIDEISMNWKRHLLDLRAPADVDALSETIDAIYDAIDRFGPGAINLATLPPATINGEHLAAILRATFAFQNQIPGWAHARGLAIHALQNANIAIDDALAGLL